MQTKVMKLQTCEICGEEDEYIIKCKQCGKLFCEYCGSADDKLCFDCLDELEDDSEDLEDFDEDDEF